MTQVTFNGILIGSTVVTDDNPKSRELYDKSRIGEILSGKFKYSLVEALYLIESGKLELLSGKKVVSSEIFIKKAQKNEKNFWLRYLVYKDLRSRGYIVKTALKFGADFRVYDKGIKPGEDHAKWVVFPVHETTTLTWHDFSAKNRVSHSTRKNLLIGIVDDEESITYYQVEWIRP